MIRNASRTEPESVPSLPPVLLSACAADFGGSGKGHFQFNDLSLLQGSGAFRQDDVKKMFNLVHNLELRQ